MTAQSSYRRPTRSARTSATVVVPSTVWAAGSTPIDPEDRWPAPILSRAVDEFSAPGDRVLLVPWPAPATRGPLTLMPSDIAAPLATIADRGREGGIELGGIPGSDRWAELVVLSLLAPHTDPIAAADRIAGLALSRLAAGGLLVVLARCTHSATGVLADPAAAVVAAAQAADLLYLQHLIAVPLSGDTVGPHPGTAAPEEGDTGTVHRVVHTDLYVFVRPRSTPAPQP